MTVATDLTEFLFASARVDQATLDRLAGLGVTGGAIATITERLRLPAVGICDAEPVGSGLFQPGAGPRHLVQPVVADGALIDLVAWRSLRPDDWRLLHGDAWVLGEDELQRAEGWPGERAPRMLRTPLDWLRAGGEGFVVVDWSSPEVHRLANLDEIEVPNRELGELLTREISRPRRLPKITVRRSRSRVA